MCGEINSLAGIYSKRLGNAEEKKYNFICFKYLNWSNLGQTLWTEMLLLMNRAI